MVRKITVAEIALEFVEFVETKGYLQDFIKNTGAVDKSDSAVILAGLIEEERKKNMGGVGKLFLVLVVVSLVSEIVWWVC